MWRRNCYPSGTPEFTPGFSGDRVTRSLVLCVCFLDRCLSLCPFSFDHYVVCPSIYGLWWPLWYLQTHLKYGPMGNVFNQINVWENWNRFVQQLDHLKVNFDWIFLRWSSTTCTLIYRKSKMAATGGFSLIEVSMGNG